MKSLIEDPVVHLNVVFGVLAVDVLGVEVGLVLVVGQVVSEQLEYLSFPLQGSVAEHSPPLLVLVLHQVSVFAHQLQQAHLAVADGSENSSSRCAHLPALFAEDIRLNEVTVLVDVYLLSRA